MLVIALAVASLSQSAPKTIAATLTPHAPTKNDSLRWSPKGAKVELTPIDGALAGSFGLGGSERRTFAVRLEKTTSAAHFDVLWIDRDADGRFDDSEKLTTTPSESRGKWWSSFESELSLRASDNGAQLTRPYPLSLWFVEDPAEPDAPPALRWSRRGWHEGECVIAGKPAFVLVTEMEMDGVFDQRDAWFLACDRASLLKAASRSLESHAWLDGQAYRPTVIDPHGRKISFEPFDPGYTEAEEAAKADTLAPERNAPRADKPLPFGHDHAAALAQAKKDNKRVLVDFETTWCGPCKTMDQLVYTAKPVVDAAKDFVAVKVDGDDHKDLVKQYGVTAYPTIVLLDSDGKELRRAVGYRSVAEMVEMLKP